MTQAIRPAVDILEDLYNIIAHYPPLQADRHHLHMDVQGGEVILSGHVRTPITYRYLLEHTAAVRGVTSVNSDRLYVEETIRLETGRRIPRGVITNVAYGTVILTGKLPPDAGIETIVNDVAQIPGVEQVVTKF
jgi:osmotically-inducible protein OsmY